MTEDEILVLPTKSLRDVRIKDDDETKTSKDEKYGETILNSGEWKERWRAYKRPSTKEEFRVYINSFRPFSHSRERAAN